MATPPLLRPFGLIVTAVGICQSLIWSVASLLAILTNTCVFEQSGNNFDFYIASYVQGGKCNLGSSLYGVETMTQDEFLAWSCVSLVFNIAWVIVSCLLFVDLYRIDKSKKILSYIYAWTAVTGIMLIFDLAATVRFGVDYNNVVTLLDNNPVIVIAVSPPAVAMTLAARGFVLYVFNIAAFVYFIMTIKELKRDNNSVERNRLRQNSTGSMFGNSFVYENNSPYNGYDTSQPPWTIQSPMVGTSPRDPWEFQSRKPAQPASPVREAYSPAAHRIVPRIPTPVSVPVAPHHIPEPDYSPPMPRRYEPKFDEQPHKSALKKPNNNLARTVL